MPHFDKIFYKRLRIILVHSFKDDVNTGKGYCRDFNVIDYRAIHALFCSKLLNFISSRPHYFDALV